MHFFDEELKEVTAKDLRARWGGGRHGERFRCYLCGHKFVIGERWRMVYANGIAGEWEPVGHGNFIVCEGCNNTDAVLLKRWRQHCEKGDQLYWWLRRP